MLNPRLATRYAKSLLDLAIEKHQLEKVYNDIMFLKELIKEHRDFTLMLRSPVIPSDKKDKIMLAVTQGKIGDLTLAFNRLLVSKQREAILPEIINAFIEQYKKKSNINVVRLTTATVVSEEVKNEIIKQIKKTSEIENIELETVVDPNIIGGFVLQAGDKLVDASISYELKEISRQFENNDFIYKIR